MVADATKYRAASGGDGMLANPGLVLQYSIGQTTMATRQAIANLYYRSVRVRAPSRSARHCRPSPPCWGSRTRLPRATSFAARSGWASPPAATTVRSSSTSGVRWFGAAAPDSRATPTRSPGPSDPSPLAELVDLVPGWDLSGLPTTDWAVDDARVDPLRDHVDLAAPLARLTFNQAAVHRDITLTANGRRLVYGGHVQGLAQGSLTRMLPGLATIVAWDGCDHIGPAFEGDLIEFRHTPLERLAAGSGQLTRFEVIGTKLADGVDGVVDPVDILRWTPIVWSP